jgi:hypothetical protein
MNSFYLDTACQVLGRHALQSRRVGDFDPERWGPWILALIQALLPCFPTPQRAHEWLTRKFYRRPIRDWWWDTSPEERKAEHQQRIRDAMLKPWSKAYTGRYAAQDFDAVVATIFEALDADALTLELLEGMMGEAELLQPARITS